jgi:hypothetical protein
MIISDLSYLESANNSAVVGGWSESDYVNIDFDTVNTFTLDIDTNLCGLDDGNFASAGAKASADIGDYHGCDPLNSFSKADALAVTTYGGDSFSGATAVAAIGY